MQLKSLQLVSKRAALAALFFSRFSSGPLKVGDNAVGVPRFEAVVVCLYRFFCFSPKKI